MTAARGELQGVTVDLIFFDIYLGVFGSAETLVVDDSSLGRVYDELWYQSGQNSYVT